MTNEELCVMIQEGRMEYMTDLYNQNIGLIRKCALRFSGYAEMDDLTQEGYFGLLKAAEQYQQDGGASFSSYAWFWINTTLQRYAGRNLMVHVPERKAALVWKARRIREEYQARYGHELTFTEVSALLDLSRSEQDDLKKAEQALTSVSLETPIAEGLTIADTVSDEAGEDPDERIFREQLRDTVQEMVDGLPDPEQQAILRERYQQDGTHSVREVAETVGLSENRVRSQHDQAIRELRKPKNRKRLESFLDDERAYSLGLRGTGLQTFRYTWTSSTERAILKAERMGERRTDR